MPIFAFLSANGITEPLDNLQVLGMSEGKDFNEAFKNLLEQETGLRKSIGVEDIQYCDIRAFELASWQFRVVDWESLLNK